MKTFVLDLDLCNGCYCCQIACKDEHVANDWSPYAKPQPDVGQFWIRLQETVRGTVPKVKVSYLPQMCRHCADAKCVTACKVGAICRRDDGLLLIDPAKCTGCQLCPDACPHGMIYFNEDLNIAQKCTGCAHLLDDGWDVPRCVDACATQALKFGEESELQELIAQATANDGASGGDRVHYLNLPKRFLAGTVYDPVEKEVIIGAKCTLQDDAGNSTQAAETDNFGDFWFHGVTAGHTYSLVIEKGGRTKVISGIQTPQDVNLGDIPMRL
jgi:Fe-S-cluster-containing dehydrogenase component